MSSVDEFSIEEKEPALYRDDTLTISGALADILVERTPEERAEFEARMARLALASASSARWSRPASPT
jgi:hypothetical protein